jgi:hypothetical protein
MLLNRKMILVIIQHAICIVFLDRSFASFRNPPFVGTRIPSFAHSFFRTLQ